MKKTKILGIALAAAMVASVASVSVFAFDAAADDMTDNTQIKESGVTVGITGSFCNWGNGGEADTPMTDDDGDGVYEGVIEIPSVTEDMVQEATMDDGTGSVPRGFSGVTFKVRLNGAWKNSWGEFEEAYIRTFNSQTNCCAEAAVGDSLKITVKLDTNAVADQSNVDPDDAIAVGAEDQYVVWPVTYTVEKAQGEPSEEPSEDPSEEPAEDPSEEPAEDPSEEPAEDPSEAPAEDPSETPAEDPSTPTTPATESSTDTKTVGTGDTTSAVALVAVVLASLGVAVVMTKKASSKE